MVPRIRAAKRQRVAQQQQLFNPMMAAAAMGQMGMNPAMMGMMNSAMPMDQEESDNDDVPLSHLVAGQPNAAADGSGTAAPPPPKASSDAAVVAGSSNGAAVPVDPGTAAATAAWANLAQGRANLYHHGGREERRITRGTGTFRAMPKAGLGVTLLIT